MGKVAQHAATLGLPPARGAPRRGEVVEHRPEARRRAADGGRCEVADRRPRLGRARRASVPASVRHRSGTKVVITSGWLADSTPQHFRRSVLAQDAKVGRNWETPVELASK